LPIKRITPSRDAYISQYYQYYPRRNFGRSRYLYISQYKQRGDDYRSLLRFSLRSIPANRRILSARLQLRVYRNEIPRGSSIYASVRRVREPWKESTVTWNNQPSSRKAFSFLLSSRDSPGSLIVLDVTSLVKKWYYGRRSNFGIMLRGNEFRNSLVGFYSDETRRAPRLIITYTKRRR